MSNNTDNGTNFAEEWTKNIFLYLYPPLYIIGTVGNIIKYIVFSRPRFRHNFFNLFRYLSIINTIVMQYVIIDFMSYLFNMNLEIVSYPFCKSVLFIVYSMGGSSGWILVLISIDRTICIFNLNNKIIAIFIKSYNSIIIIVVALNLAYYIPMIVYKEYNITLTNSTSIYACDLNDPNSIVHWMDVFNSSLVPFSLMAFLTTFTLIKLNKIRSKTNGKLKKSIYNANHNNTNDNVTSSTARTNMNLRSRDLKFAFNSIILNLFFLILNLPIALYLLLSPYLNLVGTQTDDMLYVITSFFYYMNFGISFYINLLVNSLFKNELLIVIRELFEKFK